MQVQKKRVAIVGGGISGLSCAYALRNNPRLQITLFEQEARLGGHSNTVEFTPKMQDISFGVDTGFLVFNQRTYPKLIQFFQELEVLLMVLSILLKVRNLIMEILQLI
jgi:predicted NAD/FAD-binding protein